MMKSIDDRETSTSLVQGLSDKAWLDFDFTRPPSDRTTSSRTTALYSLKRSGLVFSFDKEREDKVDWWQGNKYFFGSRLERQGLAWLWLQAPTFWSNKTLEDNGAVLSKKIIISVLIWQRERWWSRLMTEKQVPHWSKARTRGPWHSMWTR